MVARPRPLLEFLRRDNPRSFFPLDATVLFLERGEKEIREFVEEDIFHSDAKQAASFLTLPSAYALKDRHHLRRVLVLDPVATFYLYDFMHRNTSAFQAPKEGVRRYFGYSFKNKKAVQSFDDYHRFRNRKYQLQKQYRHFLRIDISNCFNCLYHHDVTQFVEDHVSLEEGQKFGRFLREGSQGRSVSCIPQGLYPAKVVGNAFLSFIERSLELKAPSIIRFLDDGYLFSDKQAELELDLLRLQHIIGERNLSLNVAKTYFGDRGPNLLFPQLDEVKVSLLQKREEVQNYDEIDDADESVELAAEELDYLISLLRTGEVAEEDVELSLALAADDEEIGLQLARMVIEEFPSLLSVLHQKIGSIEDPDGEIFATIQSRLRAKVVSESELFWLVRILSDYYTFDQEVADNLLRAYEHPAASPVVKSAVVENPENSYGLLDLKEQTLRNGQGGVLGASAVAGLQSLNKAKRNQILKYVGKSSQYMQVICQIGRNF
ncbi:MAG: hypothetical protein ACI93T_004101 [Porticoccaceae bacterium]|jgi:hypothetical protein